jgi:hypothetical protein
MQVARWLSPEEFWARIAASEQRMRESAAILPIYGVAGWSGSLMVGDWDWKNGQLVTVGLAHGHPSGDGPSVQVQTTVLHPRTAVASLRMAHLAAPHDKDDFQRRRREADAAATGHVDIAVDSVPVPFGVWNDGDPWWAAAQQADYGLILEARHMAMDQLALIRVHDIEPYLAGRRAHLRVPRADN